MSADIINLSINTTKLNLSTADAGNIQNVHHIQLTFTEEEEKCPQEII